eukprot:CAMPEP_0206601726 /NCGR_PEP_ID=MMETSP0325_2-20121206/46835_1 /ASSEMBLY_ACC=CAM_ASM_000347 /TAXON_ID=2866 /ORGANISM="Crypthecodinium cohnii, Strain Seligo" /LENGTH=73 /DNA_ID=CAMNT_0054113821 /DNA_START=17 /DNA_END=235 /DNA_ORIENTATION=+
MRGVDPADPVPSETDLARRVGMLARTRAPPPPASTQPARSARTSAGHDLGDCCNLERVTEHSEHSTKQHLHEP